MDVSVLGDSVGVSVDPGNMEKSFTICDIKTSQYVKSDQPGVRFPGRPLQGVQTLTLVEDADDQQS